MSRLENIDQTAIFNAIGSILKDERRRIADELSAAESRLQSYATDASAPAVAEARQAREAAEKAVADLRQALARLDDLATANKAVVDAAAERINFRIDSTITKTADSADKALLAATRVIRQSDQYLRNLIYRDAFDEVGTAAALGSALAAAHAGVNLVDPLFAAVKTPNISPTATLGQLVAFAANPFDADAEVRSIKKRTMGKFAEAERLFDSVTRRLDMWASVRDVIEGGLPSVELDPAIEAAALAVRHGIELGILERSILDEISRSMFRIGSDLAETRRQVSVLKLARSVAFAAQAKRLYERFADTSLSKSGKRLYTLKASLYETKRSARANTYSRVSPHIDRRTKQPVRANPTMRELLKHHRRSLEKAHG